MYDLQKASSLKRASAYILDLILLVVLITGCAAALSGILNYSKHIETMDACYDRYAAQYGIDFTADPNTLTEEQQKIYEEAEKALNQDAEAVYTYNMIISLTMVILSGSVLIGYTVLEFVVPILFKNGQTLGKKIFGIGVMRTSGIKMNNISLFIRTYLAKYSIETMIPLLLIVMMFLGVVGPIAPLITIGLAILQACMMFFTHTNSTVHDKLSDTVVVDLSSQMIFENEDALLEYQKARAAEKSAQQDY